MSGEELRAAPLTATEALRRSGFSQYRKVGTTPISDITFPPGTVYETPEGLHTDDEETRCAFDVQGGIYPIRESVFRSVYALAAPSTPEPSRPQVPSVSELREWLGLAGAEATDETATRLQRRLRAHRVASHAEHDQAGEPNEGFPVCSVCGAIQTDAAPSTEPALDREAVVRAVHDWSCGESVNHGDRRRPLSGWVCERGADAILARLAESQPTEEAL